MKIINCIMAAIFTICLCVAPFVDDASAQSVEKETVAKSIKTAPQSKQAEPKATPNSIDINSADKSTLASLPGIGPAKAEAIVKYRESNGNFTSIDDLTNVKGIGKKSLVKLKPYLKKV